MTPSLSYSIVGQVNIQTKQLAWHTVHAQINPIQPSVFAYYEAGCGQILVPGSFIEPSKVKPTWFAPH